MSALASKITKPVMRYHGGKFRLSAWVRKHFPLHRTYVEPFGGAAGVLLTKERAYSEVYNDLDGDVVNLFRVLQDPDSCNRLIQVLTLTPYAREEFSLAWELADDPIERARRLLIRAQMGFGSAGATKGVTGFRIDSQRAYGTAQSHWVAFPESLRLVAERFTGILIENRPAIEVMRQHDTPETLHYVDPPYMHETRVRGSSKARYYRHEMSDAEHLDLLAVLQDLRGMVVVSGYPCDLYTATIGHWNRTETKARISAGRGCTLRTECIWLNPAAAQALGSFDLFAKATEHRGAR